MYAHLITVTGWTWEYIDEYMTLPRLDALMDYWQDLPPTHVLTAGYVSYKSKNKPKPKQGKEAAKQDFDELASLFSEMGGKVEVVKHGK